MIQNGIIDFLKNPLFIFDIESLIRYGGMLVVFLLVYDSTGLFFCFFIPTGAVLFTTGLLTATGVLRYDIFTTCPTPCCVSSRNTFYSDAWRHCDSNAGIGAASLIYARTKAKAGLLHFI